MHALRAAPWILAAVVAGLWSLGGPGTESDPQEPVAAEAPAGPERVPAETGSAAVNFLELPPPERTECLLLLPDGTAAPSLNDVLNPRALATAWSPTRPYAPIVATFSEDNGEQWYRHADGTVSTTVMRWRADLGRMDGVTVVMHPRGAPQARVRIHDR